MPVMVMINEKGEVYGKHYCAEYRQLYWMAITYRKARPDRKFIVFHNEREMQMAGFVKEAENDVV